MTHMSRFVRLTGFAERGCKDTLQRQYVADGAIHHRGNRAGWSSGNLSKPSSTQLRLQDVPVTANPNGTFSLRGVLANACTHAPLPEGPFPARWYRCRAAVAHRLSFFLMMIPGEPSWRWRLHLHL